VVAGLFPAVSIVLELCWQA